MTTYLPTYLLTCLPAYQSTCLPAYLLTNLPAYLSFLLSSVLLLKILTIRIQDIIVRINFFFSLLLVNTYFLLPPILPSFPSLPPFPPSLLPSFPPFDSLAWGIYQHQYSPSSHIWLSLNRINTAIQENLAM